MSAPDPIGLVLAGGAGRRIGGDKATVSLAGRPLVEYPVHALRAVVAEVAVVAKRWSSVPPIDRAELWIEPDEPAHPLAGVAHGLERADGRAVLVCACDTPLVTTAVLRALLEADGGSAGAVVARAAGRIEPLVGLYRPGAREGIAAAAAAGTPAWRAVGLLDPLIVDVEDAEALLNVNAPEDVLLAAEALARRADAASRT